MEIVKTPEFGPEGGLILLTECPKLRCLCVSWVPRLLLVIEMCSAVRRSLESCSVEQVFASLQGPLRLWLP